MTPYRHSNAIRPQRDALIRAVLLEWVAHEMATALNHHATHCWQCDQPRNYDRDPRCSHCGADETPF